MSDVNMAGENVLMNKGFSNEEWESFVKSELLIFMEQHQLEKMAIDDGDGRKARLSKNKNGEWVSNITYLEKF